MSKLILLTGIAVYLYYMNMQKNNIEPPNHIKADITQEKPKIKEQGSSAPFIPIIADEKPIPAKPIAIPIVDTPSLVQGTTTKKINFQYHPTHGWINYDLMHKLPNYNPKFKTFQSKTYM